MRFAERLRQTMSELGISQAKLSALTGIGKPSISMYLSGQHEPTEARKTEMAIALGLPEDHFRALLPEPEIQELEVINLPVPVAAKMMGKSIDWVQQGLRDGVFPWGYAVKLKRWSYYISPVKFAECTGIALRKPHFADVSKMGGEKKGDGLIRKELDISDPVLCEDGPVRWVETNIDVPEGRFGVDYSKTFKALIEGGDEGEEV